MHRARFVTPLVLAALPAGALAQSPYLVKNINPTGDSFAFNLTPYNGALYFNADDGTHGSELWRSDGTTAGTQMVTELRPGLDGGFPANFREFNGRLYFSGNDGVHGNELWSTDGTAVGTTFVADTWAGPSSGNPEYFTPVGDRMFMRAMNDFGIELWTSDGTAANTAMVKDIHIGDWSLPSGLTELNGKVIFSADDSYDPNYGYDRELFISDGTEAGTYRIKDINPGPAASIPSTFTPLGNKVFFQANDGVNGIELWATDGTAAGTTLFKDLNPAGSGVPQNLTRIASSIYFIGNNGTDGDELWMTDGTVAGTQQVKDINPTGSSTPLDFTEFNGQVAFTADDGVHGIELWMSDGTDAGTHMVKDINPGPGISSPLELTVKDDEMFFVAIEPANPDFGTVLTALWKTDGTEAGTVKIWDAPGEWFGYGISDLTLVGDILYFLAPTGVDDFGLGLLLHTRQIK
ncbi:MAG TPA: hypothetical protein P5572_20880, partial [Phycisphaerae bacterium]|nr:hypothetical protein [Phycisphaerae bacterium]